MTDNIKELAKRLTAYRTLLLRADGDRDLGFQSNITTNASMALADELKVAADALEALAANRDLWRDKCVLMEAERDRLRAVLNKKLSAKAREKLGDLSESMIVMGDGHSLEILLKWYDESRKAIEGNAS